MDNEVKVFKALADKTRLRIMSSLVRSKKDLCICELMDTLKLEHYNISKHVKELKNAGLVTERKEGKYVFYSLVKPVDNFHKLILKNLALTEDKEDSTRLKKRLALRIADKCVVGIKKCCC
jgi:ArsR family transcriptional regulator